MICTAPTQPDCSVRDVQYRQRVARRGFTLAELLVVLVVISLFTALARVHLFGLLGRSTFKAQMQGFVSTLQMAARAAAESDKRYEVIIDIEEQSYLLRQITNPDLSEVLEEEIILQADLSDNCRVAYVQFDDADYTNEGRAKFRAGRAGWAYGGKIVLFDKDEKPYTVMVNRLNRIVGLEPGDVMILEPRTKDEMPF
ncbi:MAG: prepilin-type N-terminal cleavage/methylation domain-containing protein [Planctomycetota bacterium]|jgi:prepilin-type N-terminal cleavage/methylation domain-containing protein